MRQVRRGGLIGLIAILSLPVPLLAQVRAEVVASGLVNPLQVVPDPAVSGVFYVVEQRGRVVVVRDGVVQTAPFLDLRGQVGNGSEQGLLGLAFPPDAAQSGRVFVNFTNLNGDTVIARFRRRAGDPLTIDPASRFDLQWSTGLRVIAQPFSNHNGGHLLFGPDGYLYIPLGDGGSGNDPQNNAQNPATLLGKMLRVDVAVPDNDPTGLRVPADNPFVDGLPIAALPEVWAFGFRNPWRASFDDVGAGATGALISGDVGQAAREEINYEPAGAGGRNYGWRLREGRMATPGVAPTTPAYGPLVDPILDLGRDMGRSITGGFVYRGAALGAVFRGRYFFADFVTSRVWSLGLAIDPVTREARAADLIEHTAELGGAAFLGGIASFGRDLQGELYLATFAGRVLRIAPATATPNPPQDVRAAIAGSTVVVSWSPPPAGPVPGQYRLEAGSAPGLADLGVVVADGSTRSLTFPGVPAGVYFVRMRSVGAGGASGPSNEITVTVGGGCTAAPPAPSGFAATVNGRTVRLAWTLGATANGPTSFVIEAGSSSGASNVARIAVDGAARELSATAPPGVYFLRVRAVNACGSSAVSGEITVTVF